MSAESATIEQARRDLSFDQSLSLVEEELHFTIRGDREMENIAREVFDLRGSGILTGFRGGPGSGKEGFAGYVHLCDYPKNGMPFVRTNIGALSPTLFESELYGHGKGAFTNAQEARVGRFGVILNGGTLFLDEITTVGLEHQPKLLRALGGEREFSRVGENDTHRYRGRVVCATNANMQAEVDIGNLRGDIFSRIGGCMLPIPPFGERTEGHKASVIDQLLLKYIAHTRRANLLIDAPARSFLSKAAIPHEVRGLEAIVERAASYAWSSQSRLITQEHVERAHASCCESFQTGMASKTLPAASAVRDSQFNGKINADLSFDDVLAGRISFTDFMAAVRRHFHLLALRGASGNVTKAAKLVGISRTGFYKSLRKADKDSEPLD